MMRGGNRGMRRMVNKMGIDVTDVPNVQEVIIKTDKKELFISKPTVGKVKTKEGYVFTITFDDECEERELEVPVFSEEDIQLVSQQGGVSEQRAKEALEETKGDLARAILLLSSNG